MECTLDYSLSVTPSELTKKQQTLLDDLNLAISKTGIKVKVDEDITMGFPCALDVEHDEAGNLVGIGLYDGIECGYYTYVSDPLRDFIQKASIIAHNGVSDIDCLRMWGINVRNEQLVWDTMLIGHILDSSLKSYSLKDAAKRELGITYPSYDDIVGKRGLKAERITLDKQPLELVSKYNAMDVYCTYKLYERQHANIRVL